MARLTPTGELLSNLTGSTGITANQFLYARSVNNVSADVHSSMGLDLVRVNTTRIPQISVLTRKVRSSNLLTSNINSQARDYLL